MSQLLLNRRCVNYARNLHTCDLAKVGSSQSIKKKLKEVCDLYPKLLVLSQKVKNCSWNNIKSDFQPPLNTAAVSCAVRWRRTQVWKAVCSPAEPDPVARINWALNVLMHDAYAPLLDGLVKQTKKFYLLLELQPLHVDHAHMPKQPRCPWQPSGLPTY